MNFAHFCEFWCFFSPGKTSTIHIELLFRNAPVKSSCTHLSLVWFAGATPERNSLSSVFETVLPETVFGPFLKYLEVLKAQPFKALFLVGISARRKKYLAPPPPKIPRKPPSQPGASNSPFPSPEQKKYKISETSTKFWPCDSI